MFHNGYFIRCFYKYLLYISVVYQVCITWLLVYGMLVNLNGIYYVHVCDQARWDRPPGNSGTDNLCIFYYDWKLCGWIEVSSFHNAIDFLFYFCFLFFTV